MLKKIIRVIFTIIGLISGYILSGILLSIIVLSGLPFLSKAIGIISFRILITLLIGIILYFISPRIYDSIVKVIEYIEKNIQKFTATEIIYGGFGALISLILTSLIGLPLNSINLFGLGPILFVLLNLIFAISLSSSLKYPFKGSSNSPVVALYLPNAYRFTPSCTVLKSLIKVAFFELSNTPLLSKVSITAPANITITIKVMINTNNDIPFLFFIKSPQTLI